MNQIAPIKFDYQLEGLYADLKDALEAAGASRLKISFSQEASHRRRIPKAEVSWTFRAGGMVWYNAIDFTRLSWPDFILEIVQIAMVSCEGDKAKLAEFESRVRLLGQEVPVPQAVGRFGDDLRLS